MRNKEKVNKVWKVVGQIVLYGFIVVAGYFLVKQEVANFNIQSWLNPFYVKEAPEVTPRSPRPNVQNLLASVNAARDKAGVPPLKIDKRLNRSAQAKADDMKKRNYFGHVDPDGKTGNDIAHKYMPDCVVIDENITDSGEDQYNTLDAGISAWINSPPHYKAMINPKYTLTGFGITSTGLVEHFCQLK